MCLRAVSKGALVGGRAYKRFRLGRNARIRLSYGRGVFAVDVRKSRRVVAFPWRRVWFNYPLRRGALKGKHFWKGGSLLIAGVPFIARPPIC
jgi:hypothetical protein